jgi:mono/diheme cytochrome c family protein
MPVRLGIRHEVAASLPSPPASGGEGLGVRGVSAGREEGKRFDSASPNPPHPRPLSPRNGGRGERKTAPLLWVAVFVLTCFAVPARAQSTASAEFFEKKIRPLLLTHCLECHGADAKKVKGGLRLTSRAEMLKGGDSGPAIVPGEPVKSLLVKGVRFKDDDLKMPPKGRLRDSEIADLEAWVKAGAVWPETGAAAEKPKAGQLFTDEQKRFWAFQPVADPPVPAVRNTEWVRSPIDAFLLAKLEAKGLRPSKPADKYALLRRVTFDLTGLPPTTDEIDAFIKDHSPGAFETVVDRLLRSPAYGERWGRHWLDIARYADSNGLDENTAFGNAWRYRDYVIKSFQQDKPFDEFLREQIAGDLLPDASENPDRLTATGFLVLGPKLLAEPDKQKMKMDIADEQLDTLGKAVLGLTLGCARCHDHKFDPIPQRDYYSLLSVFTSTRTMKNLATVAQAFERPLPTGEKPDEAAARAKKVDEKLAAIKTITDDLRGKILADSRANVGAYLLATADAHGRAGVARMTSGNVPGAIVLEAEKYKKGTADKSNTGYGEGIGIILSYDPTHTRAEYVVTVPKAGEFELELRYAALESRPVRVSVEGKVVVPDAARGTTGGWNPEHQSWKPEGRIRLHEGKNTLAIEAHGLLPHIDKLAVLPLESMEAAVGTRPSAGTLVEVARQRKLIPEFVTGWADYLRPLKADDPLFGPWKAVAHLPDADFEQAAGPLLAKFRDRSPTGLLDGPTPKTLGELAGRYAKVLPTLEAGKRLLAAASGPFALKTPLPQNPELFYPADVARLSDVTRELEAIRKTAPPVVSVLAVEEGSKYPEVRADGKPRNLFVQVRGNYLTPGEEAPPVFPRILAGEKQQPFAAIEGDALATEANQTRYGHARNASGRLELAEWIADAKNPLTARVFVNRVWQHHFGEGLVRSTDNFGKLGEQPTHPELLDWLATRFIESGWSIKKLHKLMVLSSAYLMSSAIDDHAAAIDPENRLLWRFNRRRLEAEAIRDALLAVAENLDWKMGGTLLNNGNFTYVNNENSTNTARYDNHRRSVYLPVIRNTVFDFFQVFDFAEPHVTNGQRASTVVAPQALYLLNSPFVKEQAHVFADAVLKDPRGDDDRVHLAYRTAYGRPATSEEVGKALGYVSRYETALATSEKDMSNRRPRAWQSLCQVLFAGSEFVYVE